MWNNSYMNCGCRHESEEWSSQLIFQFKKLERRSLKKNQGFNGIRTSDLRDTGTILYQLSYEATHWERGHFIEFISPVRSDMMSTIYEIIRIWTAVVHAVVTDVLTPFWRLLWSITESDAPQHGIYFTLYNNPSNSRILIGSRLWSIRGQMHDHSRQSYFLPWNYLAWKHHIAYL